MHLLRHSLTYAGWKERKFAAALGPIYTAASAAGVHVSPFFAFPPDIRRTLYTTNARM